MKSLDNVIQEKPFTEYAAWWKIGHTFIELMSQAIVTEWRKIVKALPHQQTAVAQIENYAASYTQKVFQQQMQPDLVKHFMHSSNSHRWMSGEFDALSYAFYRHTFEMIAQHPEVFPLSMEEERRAFTQRVGRQFFRPLQEQLNLNLPTNISTQTDFIQFQDAISIVSRFLTDQGYVRQGCSFNFDVDVIHQGKQIKQTEQDAEQALLGQQQTTYALFTMGYPAILPSAVYLYHTIGEAQHHSSRTLEELFRQVGLRASETDDFDPIGYPSDKVVELWEIHPSQITC
jgi:hypothetical protein